MDERGRNQLSQPRNYLNRELSELAYQYRVLHEALDARNPLLERVKYLSFFTKNTDEFFMKRIGGLKQEIEAGMTEPTVDGRSPEAQWREALELFRSMQGEQYACWQSEVSPALKKAGIRLAAFDELDGPSQSRLLEHFDGNVLPMLTPLAYDPAHPFPFISNLSVSIGAMARSHPDADPTFTRLKVPQNLAPLLIVPGTDAQPVFVTTADLIRSNLDRILPGMEILQVSTFRLTRSAEVRLDEEVAEDLVDMIENVLERRRMAPAVRLEVAEDMPEEMLALLMDKLMLSEREIYRQAVPLNLRALDSLLDLDRLELKHPSWTPQYHPRLGPGREQTDSSIFDEIRRGDILVRVPYHSFALTTLRFFEEAARDPAVLAVKLVIYRTADDSKVLNALIEAAERNKQVAAIIELKARFEERQNVEWVRRLEHRGIHVAYGTLGLKIHTKIALVVRQEADGVRFYSHVGTGNFNSVTAESYVDTALLTADAQIGMDLVKVFNSLTGPHLDEEYERLLISPTNMRRIFTDLIRQEAGHARSGRRGRIVVKVNSLEDSRIVAELYRASQAGVEIDLIVRDICRLRPGVTGLSENVRVHSLVGHFLEHDRIFYFENDGQPHWYIGSADWMTRNLDRRIEAVTPVEDPDLRRELRAILETCLLDNRRRWVLDADENYTQVHPEDGQAVIDAQVVWQQRARAGLMKGDLYETTRSLIERLEKRMLV